MTQRIPNLLGRAPCLLLQIRKQLRDRCEAHSRILSHVSISSSSSAAENDQELSAARTWLKTFTHNQIPRTIGITTFSRSAGPGGQNVNKVNSKVTLRVGLHQLKPIIPEIFIRGLKKNGHHLVNSGQDILIQSDLTRKQSDNIDDCFQKLYRLIIDAVNVPGETSLEQKQRVKNLNQASNEKRLRQKHKQSSKKSARRGRMDGE